jgi:hypothetical protein
MEPCKTKTSGQSRILTTDPVIFFAVFYLCVWLIIDPKLIYHAFGRTLYYPPFSTGGAFLLESLTKTAGTLKYINGFLSQCFYFPWIGALIVTVIAWLFWLLSTRLFTITKSYCLPLVCYVHAILLLVVYTRYGHQLLNVLILLTALISLVLYIKTSLKNSLLAAFQFIAAFVLVGYITGTAAILFALLVGVYELLIQGRKLLGAFSFVTALVASFISFYFFDLPIQIPRLQLLSASQDVDPWIKYSIFIMCLLPFLILLEIALYKYTLKHKTTSGKSHPASKRKHTNTSKLLSYAKQVLKIAAPLVLILLTFLSSYKKIDKLVLKISYYSYNRMWQNVLKSAQKCPVNIYSSYWNHDINRALYHTGQLGDKMFSFPQKTHALLLTTESSNNPISLTTFAKRIDLFLELGHVGIAERLAYELTESTNQCPFVLEKLALINLTKKQNETAKTYLNILRKDLMYGKKAKNMLQQLKSDPQLTSDEYVQYLRSVASDVDNTVYEFDADNFFLQLLTKNKHNRMAFEYMMAFYLLTGQVDKVAENIPRLDDFEFKKMPMPSYYGEALALYIGAGKKKIDLKGHLPNLQTLQYVKSFDNKYRTFAVKGNKQGAKYALAKEYKDSYIFYFVFEIPRIQK